VQQEPPNISFQGKRWRVKRYRLVLNSLQHNVSQHAALIFTVNYKHIRTNRTTIQATYASKYNHSQSASVASKTCTKKKIWVNST